MVMAALVGCAVVAAQQASAGGRAGWAVAVTCVCVAGSVKAPAFAALPAVLLAHLASSRAAGAARRAAVDVAVAACVIAGCGLVVPDGFGWVRNLSTPGQGNRPTSPSALLSALVRALGADASDVDSVVRLAVLVLAAAVVLYLAATVRSRPLPLTVAVGLLVVAFAGPVFYPWYLLWGLLLVPLDIARRRLFVVGASTAGCLVAITGLPRGATAAVDALLAAAGLAVFAHLARPAHRRRAGTRRPARPSGQSVHPAAVASEDRPPEQQQHRERRFPDHRTPEARQERL
jgi:hypothetical protein